jgi:hypothetical protein
MFNTMPVMVSTYGRLGLLHCGAVQADLRMDSGAETQDAVHGMVVTNHQQVVRPRSQLVNQLHGVQKSRARRTRPKDPTRLIGDNLIHCRMMSRNVRHSAFADDRDMSLGVLQPEIGKEGRQQDKIAKVGQTDGQDALRFTTIEFPRVNTEDSVRCP